MQVLTKQNYRAIILLSYTSKIFTRNENLTLGFNGNLASNL